MKNNYGRKSKSVTISGDAIDEMNKSRNTHVLETYAPNTDRPHVNPLNTQSRKAPTIAEMKQHQKEVGKHWFDTGWIKMFGTQIKSPPTIDGYFITYDKDYDGGRGHTIRHYDANTGDIKTVGGLCAFKSLDNARQYRDAVRDAKRNRL